MKKIENEQLEPLLHEDLYEVPTQLAESFLVDYTTISPRLNVEYNEETSCTCRALGADTVNKSITQRWFENFGQTT